MIVREPSVAHLVKRDLGAREARATTVEAAATTTATTVTTTATTASTTTEVTATAATSTEATTAATTAATAATTEAAAVTRRGAGTSVIKAHVTGVAAGANRVAVLGLERSLGLLNGAEGDVAKALQVAGLTVDGSVYFKGE